MSAVLAATEGAHATFPLLTTLVVLPAAGALVVGLLSKRRPELCRTVALLVSVLTGALTIATLVAFEAGGAEFQMVEQYSWIRDLGISWHLGVDGISLFLLVMTGVLFPIAIIGAPAPHDEKPFLAWLLLLEAGCLGVFLALDLFVFFVMFEIVLVPMYFLISGWGYAERRYASMKFFLYTMFGSAFMLVGLIATAVLHGRATGQVTFDLVTIASQQGEIATTTARWLFLAFAIAFAIKVPLFPLHTWLPDAHTQAPTAGSVILAGVMLKLGTYGLLRFGLYLFPDAANFFAPGLVTLGVIGILYGAIVATMQKDLKRLVAYSSVAHLGFIVLGTFAMTTQGVQGGLLQNINHGVSTGALFLLVGMISERRHTREIAALRGLQRVAPIFAGVFTLVMLSSIGLPGLNGFVGEFLVLNGSFLTRRWWAVAAAAGVILAALYLLWAYQRVFHGEVDEDNKGFGELTWREGAVLAPLLGLIVFMGIYPKPVLERMEPAVDRLIAHVEGNSDFVSPSVEEPAPVDHEEAEPSGDDDADAADGADEHAEAGK
ncbi:MAG TPA: NADH-quinone oxidoreductase subunit M [Acidimicrobiales bacterium]|nr:NADH-quinone oxidoreductase subunit M [Acidimicrobiales bacterium]